ncbi:FadR/GntR family transcriptional regulator [Cerasibacillus sp. JNUCC 74]|jgi:GntR family transcriptional regulator, transcriptional repressor for pyruvate dehydrogenase complex|uniref:FadR/GntR family transcriptional regulator n=1 Tax=Virgibacillus proomii TaxID=84407 RepID=UPI00117CCAA5|nr:GntR family transcriptional regulator [Virgibacillus proomii]
MAVSMSQKQKVYQGVLKEIRQYIVTHHLQPGDKLPSERELAEILHAGRSSIREALRAMELLGLIETKRGEGTFLSRYRPFQMVELLASFVLQEEQTKTDLVKTIRLLEKEAAKLAFCHMSKQDVDELSAILEKDEMEFVHAMFFQFIFNMSHNLLLNKVWQLMYEFAITIKSISLDKEFYEQLVQLYYNKQYAAIEKLFDKLLEK